MSAIPTLVTFDTQASTVKRRLQDIKAYGFLTSRPLLILALLVFIVAIGSGIATWLTPQLSYLMAIACLAGAIFATWFLMFLYAVTFFPYRYTPVTPARLLGGRGGGSGNAAEAADFACLSIYRQSVPQETDAVKNIITLTVHHSDIQRILRRFELSATEVEKQLRTVVAPAMTYNEMWFNALNTARHEGAPALSIMHIMVAFLLHPAMQPFLRQKSLRAEDVMFAQWWFSLLRQNRADERRWWSKEKLLAFSGLGLSWAAGFTPLLDRLMYIPAGNVWDIAMGREREIESLITSLARRRQSNVLLVGQPGSGRLAIIKAVAWRIMHNKAHPALEGQRLAYVHIGQLLGLSNTIPQQMELISRLLDEMEKAGNIVAVLDGIGSLLQASAGTANMSDLLVPFFTAQRVRVVVIMSTDEYHLRLKNNDELNRLFEVVQVAPLLPEATLQLLAYILPSWEKQRRVSLSYQAMREIVDVSVSILPQIPFPEKAFDILEEVTVEAQGKRARDITVADIDAIIARKIGVPLGKVRASEAKELLELDDFIHARVVNQEAAVTAVTRAMIRARASVRTLSRPIGTFLFLGPTGVGKTETAKALAESYFGSESHLQRLDMSEYQTSDTMSRLIGDTNQGSGILTSMVADHPFSVLLLDEFEKADRAVQQLFLPVFDEGRLTDARGRTYSFKHTIIIATSNAGAEFIRQAVDEQGKVPTDFDASLREHVLRQNIFRPELLNRFDGVITFTPLSPIHIKEVARRMLGALNKRLDREHGITVAVTDDLLDFLMTIGYNADFGARPMNRAIQNTVEFAVAEGIIKNQFTPGQKLTLSVDYLRTLSK